MPEVASALHNGYTDFEPHLLDRSLVNQAAFRAANNFVGIGHVNRFYTEMEPATDGIAYVKMNSNGFVSLAPGQEGIAATSSLDGCTGVAAFAEMPNGEAKTMIAHYDEISQTHHFTRQDTPVNTLLYTFRHETGKAIPIQVVVTYPEAVCHAVDFGKQRGTFNEWHYLDQILTTAGYLGENTQVLFVPYRASLFDQAVYLAAGRHKGVLGIFYNGKLVDFEKRFSSGFNHHTWRAPHVPSYEHSNLEVIRTREELMNNWRHLAGGEGAITTENIQSEVVDEVLFDGLMNGAVDSEQETEALSELATVNYSVCSNHNEYTATVGDKQYRVSVESRSGKRLDTLDVMPNGDVEAALSHMVLSVTVLHTATDTQETHATTYYCVDDLEKRHKRLHRIDYVHKNTGVSIPAGEATAYVAGIADAIAFTNNTVAYQEPPYVTSNEQCTVQVTTPRFNDLANLKSIIPHLKRAASDSRLIP